MTDKRLLFQGEVVRRVKPINLAVGEDVLFQIEYVREFPEVYASERRLCFIPPSGWLFNRFFLSGDQFKTSPSTRGFIKAYVTSLLSLVSVRRVVKIESALFLTNLRSVNFFHWFLDVLQKTEGLVGLLGQEGFRGFTIVLPVNHESKFMRDSLDSFGLDCRWLQRDELAIIQRMTIIPDIAPTGNYRKDVIRRLGNRLVDYFSRDCVLYNTNTRIYITRKNAQKRRIINEDQLMPILVKNGFVIVDFDNLSFREQLSYILSANILVSLHGAALTHMLWMNKPGKVMEIRARDDCQNNCYYTLASDLDLEYHYAIADKTDSTRSTQLSDYVVDKAAFEGRLLEMLAR
jgi:capsular polysaccharide biosynthesis protein